MALRPHMSIIPSVPGSNPQLSGNPDAHSEEDHPKIVGVVSCAPHVIRRQRRKAKDRYIVEQLIGQGAMGAVYKARDVELERTVALKLLHPSLLDGDSELRLKRELVLASRVSHRHVVRVYDFGEIRGAKFISMAFIDGETFSPCSRGKVGLPSRA